MTPGSLPTAPVTSRVIVSRSGQPATVSQMPTRTVPSAAICMSLTMPSSVIGRWISGSLTPARAWVTCSAVGGDTTPGRLGDCCCGHAPMLRGITGRPFTPVRRARRLTVREQQRGPRGAAPADLPGRARQQPPVHRQGPRTAGGRGVPGPGGRGRARPARPTPGRRWPQALREGDWGTTIRAVRVNDVTTGWAHRDVIEVVERAGDALDVIVLPKVTGPAARDLAGPAAGPGGA